MVKLHWNPREWSYAEYILIMVVPAVLIFIFINADLYGRPVTTVLGQVVSEEENWTLKHQYRYNYVFQSESIGRVEASDYGRCHGVYMPGQKVMLNVIVGRITGQVVVGRRQPIISSVEPQ